MDENGCKDIFNKVIDPRSVLPEYPIDRIWMLMGELEDIVEDYDREVAILYISCNHSPSKHMCQTILRGKHDHEIMVVLEDVRTAMNDEVKSRRKNKTSG